MDEIHVHKTKKSICAHFAESPCKIYKNSVFRESTNALLQGWKNCALAGRISKLKN